MGGPTDPAPSGGMDAAEFDWIDGESTDGPPEDRRLPRGKTPVMVVGVTTVVLLAALLTVTAPASAHTTFTANDVSVTGNSGNLNSLTIAPSGDVHYDGLESVPSTVVVTVQVKSGGSWETVATKNVSASGLQGTTNFTFSQINLLSASSLSRNAFRASDGSSTSTDVDVRVRARLVGAGPNGADVTAASAATFTVTVTNQAAGAGVGGNANSQATAG